MTARTVISPSVSAPSCSQCATRMLLVRISPDRPGYERRTYECPWCPREMTEVFRVNELAAGLFRAVKLKSSKIFSREGRRKGGLRSPTIRALPPPRSPSDPRLGRANPVAGCSCPKESERPPPLQNADHITDPGNIAVNVWERNYKLVRPSPSPGRHSYGAPLAMCRRRGHSCLALAKPRCRGLRPDGPSRWPMNHQTVPLP
jgi:hypothetical protein